ncbi:MAG TPA: hypothetical protein VFG20_06030 [Planctomycetaceae bacterium]|jgi:hypothetical protein|nr:hypothetical protein [Planctomycetaceae bacterium]
MTLTSPQRKQGIPPVAHNYLEQLVAEWYEFQGYFVRRNVLVDPRPNGGYECELDVVAFHPETKHVVHVEASHDADSWERRQVRFARKFTAGRKHIPKIFGGLDVNVSVEQIALLAFASTQNYSHLEQGRIVLIPEFLSKIFAKLKGRRLNSSAVPEQFPLIRTLQLVAENFNLPEALPAEVLE